MTCPMLYSLSEQELEKKLDQLAPHLMFFPNRHCVFFLFSQVNCLSFLSVRNSSLDV